MRAGRICTRETISVAPGDDVSRIAHLMAENHVGAVVVEEGGRPLGVVTDRDIAVRCGGRRERLASVLAREVMTPDPLVAGEEEDIIDVLDRMKARGVRRVPLINEGGFLVGMLSMDDILLHLARTMRHLAEVVLTEIQHEG